MQLETHAPGLSNDINSMRPCLMILFSWFFILFRSRKHTVMSQKQIPSALVPAFGVWWEVSLNLPSSSTGTCLLNSRPTPVCWYVISENLLLRSEEEFSMTSRTLMYQWLSDARKWRKGPSNFGPEISISTWHKNRIILDASIARFDSLAFWRSPPPRSLQAHKSLSYWVCFVQLLQKFCLNDNQRGTIRWYPQERLDNCAKFCSGFPSIVLANRSYILISKVEGW